MTQMVMCEPGALGAQPSSHFVGVHSMRKGVASFSGSPSMPHASSWHMRMMVARYAIAPSPASIEERYVLARSVLLRAVHIVPLLTRSIVYFVCVCSLIAVQQLHCVCFALFAAVALLFFSKVKE